MAGRRPAHPARLVPAGLAALAVLAVAAAGGCTSVMPPEEPPPATTSPSFAAFDPPARFDLDAAVRLKAVDETYQGTLDGFIYYTLDSNAVIWGVDVRSGDAVLSASLPGYDTGPIDAWRCWQQVVDEARVYTIAANQQGDPQAPAPLELTAVDKASGEIAWRYTVPTTQPPLATECGATLDFSLTMTTAGLLVVFSERAAAEPPEDGENSGAAFTSQSVMLDPASGTVIWQASFAVQATGQAAYGIAVQNAGATDEPGTDGTGGTGAAPPAPAQLVAVQLATGQPGPPIVVDQPGDATRPVSYQLAGQSGDNLVVLQQQTPATTGDTASSEAADMTTTILQVVAASGQLSDDSPVNMNDSDLINCQLASDALLVCTKASDQTTAAAVTIADGKTHWQHAFTGQPGITPLLFHGYLYGTNQPGSQAFVLDTSSGQIIQTGVYPQPIAVNPNGLIFSVNDGPQGPGWQCWWAPALG